ncbi:LacI family DNA-binding transcriptional regulator [Frondihabitans australicus]|uniref:LacI family transcriptional regulator n=1 Tax=Frondihabitans australicus TaxID=386892 RepID=A0A495IKY5_9MICO|nr:LacI family DNA-binding transcriptional regulator [Frondihabitans australicus]RKR76593.1 LacI family transcriptional regulator [Frondihabitans australicus]
MSSVSVRDVAALAGVSVGTVSNVLNRPDKVSEQALARVHDAIDRLGFVRNDAARQLRAGRSLNFGLIVLDAGNPFFSDLARGAEDRAADDGLSVLLGNSGGDRTRESGYLDLFEKQRVSGVLLSPLGDSVARLRQLRERGIPSVLVDRAAPGSPFSSVSVDDVSGGRIAAGHLLDTGRRRLAFVGGPHSIRQVSDRLSGAREAVAAAGATLEVIPTAALTVLEGRAVGEALAGRPEASRPDAVFCANDLVAVGMLQGLGILQGVRVPADIAIIGYDDIAFAQSTVVPLSSVRQPARLIGRTGLEILLAESSVEAPLEPRHVVYQPELVVRASTVPA